MSSVAAGNVATNADAVGAGAEYDYAACVVNECCYLSA